MRTLSRTRALVFFSVLLPIGSVSARQFSAPEAASPSLPTSADPTAVAAVQKSLAAQSNGVTIADITMTGTARRIAGSDDETGTVVVRAVSTGDARMDLSFPSGPSTEIFGNSDKGPVGAWSGPDGVEKPIPVFDSVTDPAWFSPAMMLGKWMLPSRTIASGADTQTKDGQSVTHLSVYRIFSQSPSHIQAMMQRDSKMELYLDPQTSLPSSISFNTHPDNTVSISVPVEIRFSDYRKVNGVEVAFHVQKYLNGGLFLDLQFDHADVNTGLTAKDFPVPAFAEPVPTPAPAQ